VTTTVADQHTSIMVRRAIFSLPLSFGPKVLMLRLTFSWKMMEQ
jgi:hypothetical protein